MGIDAARIVPKHVYPAIGGRPAHARHIAVVITRTRTGGNILDVEVLTRFCKVLQPVKKTLGQGNTLVILLFELIGGEILELLIGFDSLTDQDGIRSVCERAVIVDDAFFIEALNRVLPTLEVLLTLVIDPLDGNAFGDDDQTVEAWSRFRNNYLSKFETELVAIEQAPGYKLAVNRAKDVSRHVSDHFFLHGQFPF